MECFKCGKAVPPSFSVRVGEPMPDDAYYMMNVAPNSSLVGMMRPVHHKCLPPPVFTNSGRGV